MKISRPLLISTIAIVGMTTMGAGVIYAAQAPGAHNRMSGLVSAIATKFNLNQADVQKVFDDQRQQDIQKMDAQRQQSEKTRLDQAVKDGKLTQAQEDLIIAKHAEVKTFMATLTSKTPAERQAAMKTETDSLKAWTTANNIPAQFLMPFGGGMGGPGRIGDRFEGGRGKGMGMGRFAKPGQSPTPTTAPTPNL